MKKHFVIALALASVVAATLAQTPKQQGIKNPPPQISSKLIDSKRLLADVETLSADSMEGRRAGTPGGERARAYVARRFEEAGLRPFGPSYQHEVKLTPARDGGERGANVIGYVEGKANPRRYLVVTAHYDHVGVRNGQIYNGADDNASGVAGLLALAEYFHRHRPDNSLIFAALDAEEGSGSGARTLVKTPPVDIRSIVMDVNLDMVSHSDRGELYAVGTYHYPFLKPYLERVAARAPVKLLLGHDSPALPKSEDWTTQSDHAAFHREKIPFVYFGVEDHKDYHKPTDDYATITPEFFVRATETILEAVKAFDADLAAIAKARAER
ncbi:MAG TPA: M20/M25/M40 family metallo-hydrolase [Pyrinomonadaceae bacterium]|nr:M20/M25/M40 family metallo-hydrolase [Pyrinomonadaceae bacterium]